MRILAVTHVFPWPANNGARIRVANVVRALAQAGEVELFSILSAKEGREVDVGTALAGEPVVRTGMAVRPSSSYSVRRRLRWIALDSLPYEVSTRDYSEVRSAFLAWAQPRYDLIWMEHAETFVALHDLVEAPCIVDLDDLEDYKTRGRLRAKREERARSSWKQRVAPATVARSWGSTLQGRFDVRRWRKLQQQIASSVDAVTVCSALDRARLGVPNCFVVPNGYPPPPQPLGRLEVGEPPTLILAGALSYTPNADAARYLVRDILPRIRTRLPDAQVRLVGEFDDRAEELRGEGVTLTGRVPDIGKELAGADVVVAPLRFGGGTRIKIIEAFAHRIPVVSTSVGCEGLDAVDGRHLLVADGPDLLASACIELLSNPALRASLVGAAHDLYLERYRQEVIAPMIAELASVVARESWPGIHAGPLKPGVPVDGAGQRRGSAG